MMQMASAHGPVWPAWVILGLGAATIGFLQIVGVADNGTSNGFTIIAVLATAILLGFGRYFFLRFRGEPSGGALRQQRPLSWCCAAFFVWMALLEIWFPRLHGRWTPAPDTVLAQEKLKEEQREADVRPTPHDYPGFLGAKRDGFVPDVQLNTDWAANPPKQVLAATDWRGLLGFCCGRSGSNHSRTARRGRISRMLRSEDRQAAMASCHSSAAL